MCNSTNYGAVIRYSCDAIHHCQGTRCWGPGPVTLPVRLGGWGWASSPSTGLSHNRRVRGDRSPITAWPPPRLISTSHGVAV